jgi:hypothetical protein
MRIAHAVAVAMVAAAGCGTGSDSSAPSSTTMAPNVQAASLQSCADSIESAIRSFEANRGAALDKDVAAVLDDLLPSALSGTTIPDYASTWTNLRALTAETKAELSAIRQRCAEQLPQCPNAGGRTVEAVNAILDEGLQRALNYKTNPAALTEPSNLSVPAVTCA